MKLYLILISSYSACAAILQSDDFVKCFLMQLLELLVYFPIVLKVHFDLPHCLFVQPRAQGPPCSCDEGLELKWGHLRGSEACVAFREVFDARQWHPLGRDDGRWEGATKVFLEWKLSEKGGWPCLHPLPLAQENIVFSTSNVLFVSKVIQLLLYSHLMHTRCIPFVPKSAWHYTINASASVKS